MKWEHKIGNILGPVRLGGYQYVPSQSNASAAASVYFDELYIVHEKNNVTLQVLQASDYYPFGLSFNQYQADRLKETSPGNYTPELRNRYLFQGQELQKDLDLGWYQFKWRMHDPAIGRFGAVDSLSEKYVHNSPFAFAENRLIDSVELEGLEWRNSTRDDNVLDLTGFGTCVQLVGEPPCTPPDVDFKIFRLTKKILEVEEWVNGSPPLFPGKIQYINIKP
jgi:RHS repeat-associated protein